MNIRSITRFIIGLMLGIALGAGSVIVNQTVAFIGIDPNAVGSEVESIRPKFEPDRVRKRVLNRRERIKVREEAADRARAAAAAEKAVAADQPSPSSASADGLWPARESGVSPTRSGVCVELNKILISLRRQVLRIIPKDDESSFIRKAVKVAFDGAIDANGCRNEGTEGSDGTEVQMREVAPAPHQSPTAPAEDENAGSGAGQASISSEKVDNNCETYSPRRRVNCLESERKGIQW